MAHVAHSIASHGGPKTAVAASGGAACGGAGSDSSTLFSERCPSTVTAQVASSSLQQLAECCPLAAAAGSSRCCSAGCQHSSCHIPTTAAAAASLHCEPPPGDSASEELPPQPRASSEAETSSRTEGAAPRWPLSPPAATDSASDATVAEPRSTQPLPPHSSWWQHRHSDDHDDPPERTSHLWPFKLRPQAAETPPAVRSGLQPHRQTSQAEFASSWIGGSAGESPPPAPAASNNDRGRPFGAAAAASGDSRGGGGLPFARRQLPSPSALQWQPYLEAPPEARHPAGQAGKRAPAAGRPAAMETLNVGIMPEASEPAWLLDAEGCDGLWEPEQLLEACLPLSPEGAESPALRCADLKQPRQPASLPSSRTPNDATGDDPATGSDAAHPFSSDRHDFQISDEEGSLSDDSAGADSYSDDDFRMFEFKVRRCTRSRSHDWTECPFAHPGEKAKRRDPRRFRYHGSPCPDFRKGSCRRGDACEFAHGVFECWLHPNRYRTQPCKDGRACRRRVCFFAHTQEQLRLMPAAAVATTACGLDRDALLRDLPEEGEGTVEGGEGGWGAASAGGSAPNPQASAKEAWEQQDSWGHPSTPASPPAGALEQQQDVLQALEELVGSLPSSASEGRLSPRLVGGRGGQHKLGSLRTVSAPSDRASASAAHAARAPAGPSAQSFPRSSSSSPSHGTLHGAPEAGLQEAHLHGWHGPTASPLHQQRGGSAADLLGPPRAAAASGLPSLPEHEVQWLPLQHKRTEPLGPQHLHHLQHQQQQQQQHHLQQQQQQQGRGEYRQQEHLLRHGSSSMPDPQRHGSFPPAFALVHPHGYPVALSTTAAAAPHPYAQPPPPQHFFLYPLSVPVMPDTPVTLLASHPHAYAAQQMPLHLLPAGHGPPPLPPAGSHAPPSVPLHPSQLEARLAGYGGYEVPPPALPAAAALGRSFSGEGQSTIHTGGEPARFIMASPQSPARHSSRRRSLDGCPSFTQGPAAGQQQQQMEGKFSLPGTPVRGPTNSSSPRSNFERSRAQAAAERLQASLLRDMAASGGTLLQSEAAQMQRPGAPHAALPPPALQQQSSAPLQRLTHRCAVAGLEGREHRGAAGRQLHVSRSLPQGVVTLQGVAGSPESALEGLAMQVLPYPQWKSAGNFGSPAVEAEHAEPWAGGIPPALTGGRQHMLTFPPDESLQAGAVSGRREGSMWPHSGGQQQRTPAEAPAQRLSSLGRAVSDRSDYGQASCLPDLRWVSNLIDE